VKPFDSRRLVPSSCAAALRVMIILVTAGVTGGYGPAATELSPLKIGGGLINVELNAEGSSPGAADLHWWIEAAAKSVSRYYGRYPMPELELQIRVAGEPGVSHGNTLGGKQHARTRVTVGAGTTAEQFRSDWVLPHEMVHLAFPNVADEHHWMEEGIATYVEPIARLQAGYLKPEKVWGDLVRDLPQGLPRSGDKGLDRTRTWANTYWGGALFCFLADVKIRQQTHNQKGLQDALRGILAAGGNIGEDWDLERAIAAGDQATGTRVLQQLYAEAKDKPMEVDLDAMWQQLGVARRDGVTTFNERAPLAAVRRSINAGKKQR
jgi:hypothetical protein